MYLTQLPKVLHSLLPGLTCQVNTSEPVVYLTFDDGPSPELTPWLLDLLKDYSAQATFFCLGKQVKAHPTLYKKIKDEGHIVGHHTFDHSNGWQVSTKQYLEDVQNGYSFIPSSLFRPPYGRLTPRQYFSLFPNYQIIMWDILPCDFDTAESPEKVLQVAKQAQPGSIIVFHDNPKARQNLVYALPETLAYFSARGFTFAGMNEE